MSSQKILVVGVSGQGVLSAARVIGDAARHAGLPVCLGQLHGMAQRGGSVESTVVLGADHQAHIGSGQADVVLGFEPLETRRALSRMSAGCVVVMNTRPVALTTLTQKGRDYPAVDELVTTIAAVAEQVHCLDATRVAQAVGNARAANVVMLGALASLGLLPFDSDALDWAVERRSPAHFSINQLACRRGREALSSIGRVGRSS